MMLLYLVVSLFWSRYISIELSLWLYASVALHILFTITLFLHWYSVLCFCVAPPPLVGSSDALLICWWINWSTFLNCYILIYITQYHFICWYLYQQCFYQLLCGSKSFESFMCYSIYILNLPFIYKFTLLIQPIEWYLCSIALLSFPCIIACAVRKNGGGAGSHWWRGGVLCFTL